MSAPVSDAEGLVPESNLDELLAAAWRRDRPAQQIWPAAAAAISVLSWHERFVEARELAEATLVDLRADPGCLFTCTVPFDEAIMMGAVETGEAPKDALSAMAAVVPGDTVFGKRLLWLIDKLNDQSPHEFMTGTPHELPAKPLKAKDVELAEKAPAELTDFERRKLWVVAQKCGKPEIAFRLVDAGAPLPQYVTAFWIARKLLQAGRVDDGTQLLLATLPSQPPPASEPWAVTPGGIMEQPDMRAAYADSLRPTVLAQIDISTIPGIES